MFRRKKFDKNVSILVDILTQRLDALEAKISEKIDEKIDKILNEDREIQITIKK